MEAFCIKHGVSRAWFYQVRSMAAEQGQAAMVKDSTRPRSSPGRVSKFFTDAVLTERQRLKSEGKDFGADSVLFSLGHPGLEGLPSRSTVVRIFDRAHVVDRNRKKRPKRSHRRFAAKFPNQRWQSDAFTEKLTGGEEVPVIEILDDAARFSLKISVAQSESSDPIVAAFKEAIETHGKPVLVHTDNGSAYNTQRWNRRTALVDYLHDLGIKTITGRPENPKSQGKVERSHQTLQAFIAAHRDRCATAEQLETILVQQYQSWYNYHRANQALGRETTPADVYETIQKVFPVGDPITPTSPAQQPAQSSLTAGSSAVASRKVSARGSIPYGNRVIAVGRALTGQQIRLIEHPERLEFYNHEGTHLATLDWPTPMRNATVVKQIRTVY